MAARPTTHRPNCLAEYRPGLDTPGTRHYPRPTEDRHQGRVLPESRMIRVWVLESQLEQARAIAERALSGHDAI